jgi:predicted nucleic acid-binding protein
MTLFDTSVIIDARDEQSPWHRWAQERIADAVATDGAGVNAVVLSEATHRLGIRPVLPRKAKRRSFRENTRWEEEIFSKNLAHKHRHFRNDICENSLIIFFFSVLFGAY